MARVKKDLKLEPYRQFTTQYYTVEVYCHRGQRMSAPVKRIKNCFVDSTSGRGQVVMIRDREYKDLGSLIFANVNLQSDGIWVYGVEQYDASVCYYQVWALIPEPNAYSD